MDRKVKAELEDHIDLSVRWVGSETENVEPNNPLSMIITEETEHIH